jgi:hypothetical protein
MRKTHDKDYENLTSSKYKDSDTVSYNERSSDMGYLSLNKNPKGMNIGLNNNPDLSEFPGRHNKIFDFN